MRNTDFYKFATSKCGVNGMAIDDYSRYLNNRPYGVAGSVRNSYVNPTIIEERQLNAVCMDVFSRLMMDRILFIGDEIDDNLANILTAQMLFLDNNEDEKPISMYINSPGGVVSAGLGIYDTMQYISTPVHTICTGMAASMASVLLVAGEKDNRFALPHSRIMIHQPMGGAYGQASDIEISCNEITKIKKELCEIIAKHSEQDVEKILEDCERDYWMTSMEAKEYGMIDEVLTKE